MTPADMRGWVKAAYPTASWSEKVSKMPERQIIALYYRFKKEGKIK